MSYLHFSYSLSGLCVSFFNFVFIYVLIIPGISDIFRRLTCFIGRRKSMISSKKKHEEFSEKLEKSIFQHVLQHDRRVVL